MACQDIFRFFLDLFTISFVIYQVIIFLLS